MSKSAPATPDYVGAAQQTAQSSQEQTEAQTYANRPNTNTPWSQQVWSNTPVMDPTTGKLVNQWTSNTNLVPQAQDALNNELGTAKNLTGTAQTLTGQANDLLTQPVDWSGFTPIASTPGSSNAYANKAADAAYQQYANRNLPLQDQAKDAMRTQLYNSGLREGDQAYDTAMKNLENQQSDANTQASLGATQFGVQGGATMQGEDLASANFQDTSRQQQISEDLQKRGFTTNEIMSLLTGQQVGVGPQPTFSNAGVAPGTNYTGAMQNSYQGALNQSNAQNATTSAIGSDVGAAAMMAFMF